MYYKNMNIEKFHIDRDVIKAIILAFFVQVIFYSSNSFSVMLSYTGVAILIIASSILKLEMLTLLFFALLSNQRLLILPFSDISMINIVIFAILFKQIIGNCFKINYNILKDYILYYLQ